MIRRTLDVGSADRAGHEGRGAEGEPPVRSTRIARGDDGRAALRTTLIALVASVVGVAAGMTAVSLGLIDAGQAAESATAAPEDDCGQRTAVRVSAPSEIAPALTDLAGDTADVPGLACADVEVTVDPPSRVREALTRGWVEDSDGPPPHVWIARTSLEVDLARDAARGQLSDDVTSIALSPAVIAMPRPMAQVLDWPEGELSWNAVAKLAAADDAWAQRDQPDWGRFRLGLVEQVDAEPSMGAVAALTNAVGALPDDPASPSAPPDAAQLEARAQLLLLERTVDYRGEDTAAQLDALRTADAEGALLTSVSALPLTEQLVWRYNGGADGAEPDTPLVAWYPPDGAADADYPSVVLDGLASSPRTNAAADAFLDLVVSDAGRERLRAEGFRDASRQATPLLSEAMGVRPALAPPAPEPVGAPVVAPVLRAWRGLSQTGNILTLFDVSGSMVTPVEGTGATRLELSVAGAAGGVQLFDPKTSLGLWEFSTDLGPDGADHRELVPLGPLEEEVDGTDRRSAIVGALQQLQPQADTGLYDTVAAAYDFMLERYEPGRINAVLVFTDGANDDDGLTLSQLQERLRERVDPDRPVLVLAVGYGPDADFEALSAITTVTDGKLYVLQQPEDIRNVFIDVQTGGVR